MPEENTARPIDLVMLLGAGALEPDRSYVERKEERRPASWLAMIRLPDGEEIPSSVKDISPSGARLAVPERYDLPPVFAFRIIGKDFVLRARLAWRRDGYAGIEILKVGRLPTTAPGAHSSGTPSSGARNEPGRPSGASRLRERVFARHD